MRFLRQLDCADGAIEKALEQMPADGEFGSLQVVTVKIEKVEGEKHRFRRRALAAPSTERTLQRPEIRSTLFVQHDRLAVENGSPEAQVLGSGCNCRKAVRPIMAAARDDPHTLRLDVNRQAVTVPLHFERPIRAFGRGSL